LIRDAIQVNKPWWESLATILWWIFTHLWAPATAIGWPLFAIYALSNPRTADMTALNLRRGEAAVYAAARIVERSFRFADIQ
jgi:hypothetical protein